jgi:hypothetical protein
MYGQPQGQPMMQQQGQPMMMQQQQPMMMQQQQPMMMQQQQPMMMQQQQPMMMQPGMQQQPMMMQPGMQQPMYGQPMMMQQPQVVINLGGGALPGQAPAEKTKPKKGWERIQDRDGIFIKQKMDLLEMMSGCEQGNTYNVFPLGKDGDKKGRKFYKAKEKSGCFSKQCMSADCRPFSLKVNLDDDDEQFDNEPFLILDRPCKCTFMCLERPEMTVFCVEDGKNDFIGKIKDVWTCCNIVLEIIGEDGGLRYILEASCCQLGFHCKGPMDACQTIDFEIKSPSGEIVSTLQKKSPGCAAAMVSEATNFVVHFPNKATKEDKALLMAATMLLDYRYFEEKPNRDQRHQRF